MVKNYKHKRQKSSLSNIGYYIPEGSPSSTGDSSISHNLSTQIPPSQSMSTNLSSQGATNLPSQLPSQMTAQMASQMPQSSPLPSNLEEYSNIRSATPLVDYDQDPYLNYNFPSNSIQPTLQPPLSSLNQPMLNDRYYYNNQSMYLDSGFNYLPPPSNNNQAFPSNVPPNVSTIPQSNVPQSLHSHSQSLSSTSPQTNPKPISTANTPKRSPKRKYKHKKSNSMSSIPQSLPLNLPSNAPVSIPNAVDRVPPLFPTSLKHQKNNLSISSHFNLFNLNEPEIKKEHDQGLGSSSAVGTDGDIGTVKRGLGISAGSGNPDKYLSHPIMSDLIGEILQIEPSSINTFLLKVLSKVNNIPLDDFYNLLYNNNLEISHNFNEKLDKSSILHNSINNLETINEILEIFKKPESINNLLASTTSNKTDNLSTISENKLHNINYHELLRTFLAIKILQDMLVQLPRDDNKDVTKYNIPRLSLYKTYYIICQKLLLHYPSSFQANNDHHKLILGQSKLGKLIKLVYPDLLIKRLGSRGESKYNYLGVVWNDNIINNDIKVLCDKNELPELNQFFNNQFKLKFDRVLTDNIQSESIETSLSASNEFLESDEVLNYQNDRRLNESSLIHRGSGSSDGDIFTPQYSFINHGLKFPEDFNLMNFINKSKIKIYDSVENSLISSINEIFLSNQLKSVYQELHNVLGYTSNEKLYLLILLELIPPLLFLKPSNDLEIIKLNLIEFINEDNDEDLIKLKIILKNLINLNDSLINILNIIMTDSNILADFKNYFNSSSFLTNFLNSLISYNFEIPVNLEFINEDLSLVKNFFVNDLVQFFSNLSAESENIEGQTLPPDHGESAILSPNKYNNLINFINLIDRLVLLFKNYSINLTNNFIKLIVNDLLKLIYFKGKSSNSFNHWWLINNFIEDYMNLVGELIGLDSL